MLMRLSFQEERPNRADIIERDERREDGQSVEQREAKWIAVRNPGFECGEVEDAINPVLFVTSFESHFNEKIRLRFARDCSIKQNRP